MKFLWQIMVPCNYNDGKPVRTRHHKEWDRKVQTISNGLTINAPGRGKWKSPNGEVFVDRIIPVQISCTEDEMWDIAQMTKEHYRQEAVMVFCLSKQVHII